mmetsp:Transcript_46365/g.131104  ORF Transcript_46365/g.131104 Transcript_46365/m.131104 type:complete len:209 (+) Transcript_46365:2053-2679(+)
MGSAGPQHTPHRAQLPHRRLERRRRGATPVQHGECHPQGHQQLRRSLGVQLHGHHGARDPAHLHRHGVPRAEAQAGPRADNVLARGRRRARRRPEAVHEQAVLGRGLVVQLGRGGGDEKGRGRRLHLHSDAGGQRLRGVPDPHGRKARQGASSTSALCVQGHKLTRSKHRRRQRRADLVHRRPAAQRAPAGRRRRHQGRRGRQGPRFH